MSRILTLVAAGLLAVSASTASAKGNVEAGKAKAAQVCAACHGADGNKPTAPDFPILAGQHADFLLKALQDYKSGKRNNAIMKGFAAALSKQEMEDLAAFFASQPSGLKTTR